MPLPHVKGERFFEQMHAFRGCPSVICIQVQNDDWPPSNIRIMEEYGVDSSWEKLFPHPQPQLGGFLRLKDAKALAYSKYRDTALVHKIDLSFYWCDVEKLGKSELVIRGASCRLMIRLSVSIVLFRSMLMQNRCLKTELQVEEPN